MGRHGCSTNLIEEILTVVRQSPMIQINGILTPFADAENVHAFTLEQKKQFPRALRIISKCSQ
jgi:alanine racemase